MGLWFLSLGALKSSGFFWLFWLLALVGIVYVLDTLSVILQVFSSGVWKKNILMSPLHHFEPGERE